MSEGNGKVTIRDVYEQIENLREEIREQYVTKVEFWPVKSIVYGGAGIVLVSVVGALITLVLQK